MKHHDEHDEHRKRTQSIQLDQLDASKIIIPTRTTAFLSHSNRHHLVIASNAQVARGSMGKTRAVKTFPALCSSSAGSRASCRISPRWQWKSTRFWSENHSSMHRWRFPEMGATPKWMVYWMENPTCKWMIWRYHDSGNPHMSFCLFQCWMKLQNWSKLYVQSAYNGRSATHTGESNDHFFFKRHINHTIASSSTTFGWRQMAVN